MEVKAKDIVIFAAIVISIVSLGVAGSAIMKSPSVPGQISVYLQDPDNLQFILDNIGLLQDEEAVKWLKANYVSHGVFAAHNIILNGTLDALADDLKSAGLAVTTLQNRFIIIEHTNFDSPTNQDSTAKCAGDFDLTAIGIDGKERDQFTQNKPVYIRGNFDTPGAQYDYQILKAGSNVAIKSNVGFVESDNIVLGIFNIRGDAELGSYTAEFAIKGVTDCISFSIILNE